MSTVDLTKVAGFKAVNAEGNDIGVVSLSEMTNMVKESIIQEAVAMQSVSTLAEASTLAATDTYEDQLPTSDTFSYVRTLDSSGNPKRTSSSAFASVVGELIGKATLTKNGLLGARGFQPQGIITKSTYSNKLEPGVYSTTDEIIPGLVQARTGLILVFRSSASDITDCILHVYTTLWADAVYYRFINGTTYENYTVWMRLSGVRTDIAWTPT